MSVISPVGEFRFDFRRNAGAGRRLRARFRSAGAILPARACSSRARVGPRRSSPACDFSAGSGISTPLLHGVDRCSGRDYRGADPTRSGRRVFEGDLHLAARHRTGRQDRVLADVFGDVLLGVVRAHLLLVDVLLEDVAEHVGIDLVVGAQRALVEVPLVAGRRSRRCARRPRRESGFPRRSVGFSSSCTSNRPPLRYGMLPSSFSSPARGPSRLPKPSWKGAAGNSGRRNRTCPCLLLLAAVEPVAEIIVVAVEEALSLDEIDEHQAVEHDGGIPFMVGAFGDAGDEFQEGIVFLLKNVRRTVW